MFTLVCHAFMTTVVAHAALTGPASARNNVEATAKFDEYVKVRGRNYHAIEYDSRREIFKQRLQLISMQNTRVDRLWTAGVNDLTDRTEDELQQLRGWRRAGGPEGHAGTAASLLGQSSTVVETPVDVVDWRSLSMAHEVPNQGACGSCWAVATAAMLQGRHEVQMKANRTFSSQQLVNCVPNPKDCGGTGGCDGATVELAMSYVEAMGLSTDHDVPYVGADSTCSAPLHKEVSHGQASSFLSTFRRNAGFSQLGLKSWRKLPENQALPLMLALSGGPVAVSVGASEWWPYEGGIFNSCGPDSVIDHAVVLFGYGQGHEGSEKGQNYWLVRNSWGDSFGEAGFIRIFRHATSTEDDASCGVDHDPKAGVACKPYPAKVRVCGQCGIIYDSVAADFTGGISR